MKKKRNITYKITFLLLATTSATLLLTGGIGAWSLYSMKNISAESSRKLGETAAADAERALKDMTGEQLMGTATEKALYIQEKFDGVAAYVRGIADAAQKIYENPDGYPDREVALPVKGSTQLAAQLLWSKRLGEPEEAQLAEIRKLGNIQDLLVQYNANNDMVSSTYLATASGWMIQADYISDSKYANGSDAPDFYEADGRQWYQRALLADEGEIVYSDVIADVHQGGNCIVCAEPVYHDGEVVAVAGVGSYLDTVNETVLNTAIGESGYAFLVGAGGQVLVSPKETGETAAAAEEQRDLRESENETLAFAVSHALEGGSGLEKLVLDEKEVYLAYAPLTGLGWGFLTVIDAKEATEAITAGRQEILDVSGETAALQDTAIKNTALLFSLVFAATAAAVVTVGVRLGKKITDPIATELKLGAKLQSDMLPDGKCAFPKREEITLYASMTPAKEVGGDFYDYFFTDEHHLALVVADVSGKGIPAALFMVVAKTLLRSHITTPERLAEAVGETNELLCANNKDGMFVTVWAGILDVRDGTLTYVNAGHCRPLVYRDKSAFRYLTERGGFVLGGMEGMQYEQTTIRLSPGDVIFQYSDGVTEANDERGALYGEERLVRILNGNCEREPEQMAEAVWGDIRKFQGAAQQFDDITMLALRYNGDIRTCRTGEADVKYMPQVMEFVEENLDRHHFSEKTKVKILVAVDEIFSNICHYSGASSSTVSVEIAGMEARVIFTDDGTPYNPLEQKEPDLTLDAKSRPIGGLGIYMVKKTMDAVTYEYEYAEGQNRLTILKADREETQQ